MFGKGEENFSTFGIMAGSPKAHIEENAAGNAVSTYLKRTCAS
jgi:hypothetical protein